MEKSDKVILSWPEERKQLLRSSDIKTLFRKEKFTEKMTGLLSATKTSVTLHMKTIDGAQKTIEYFNGKQIDRIGKLKVEFEFSHEKVPQAPPNKKQKTSQPMFAAIKNLQNRVQGMQSSSGNDNHSQKNEKIPSLMHISTRTNSAHREKLRSNGRPRIESSSQRKFQPHTPTIPATNHYVKENESSQTKYTSFSSPKIDEKATHAKNGASTYIRPLSGPYPDPKRLQNLNLEYDHRKSDSIKGKISPIARSSVGSKISSNRYNNKSSDQQAEFCNTRTGSMTFYNRTRPMNTKADYTRSEARNLSSRDGVHRKDHRTAFTPKAPTKQLSITDDNWRQNDRNMHQRNSAPVPVIEFNRGHDNGYKQKKDDPQSSTHTRGRSSSVKRRHEHSHPKKKKLLPHKATTLNAPFPSPKTPITTVTSTQSKTEAETANLNPSNNGSDQDQQVWDWKVGDRCYARYVNDGRWYEAEIFNIQRNSCSIEYVEYKSSTEQKLLSELLTNPPMDPSPIVRIESVNKYQMDRLEACNEIMMFLKNQFDITVKFDDFYNPPGNYQQCCYAVMDTQEMADTVIKHIVNFPRQNGDKLMTRYAEPMVVDIVNKRKAREKESYKNRQNQNTTRQQYRHVLDSWTFISENNGPKPREKQPKNRSRARKEAEEALIQPSL